MHLSALGVNLSFVARNARSLAREPEPPAAVAETTAELVKSITLPQAVALYAGAVVGAGVLILPGVAASKAGPGSLLAWAFDGALGIPLALTFAALAARYPDAGGVAVYASRAFSDAAGAVVGWFYFFAASVAQALVVLTGAHYAADALHRGKDTTFLVAGAILALAVVANLRGLRVSGRLQLVLAAGVALVLLAATLAALPHLHLANLTPLVPKGWGRSAAPPSCSSSPSSAGRRSRTCRPSSGTRSATSRAPR